MILTNKRKRISGILLVLAVIACIMTGVLSVHKTAAADGEFECSETKCLLSNDKTGMLIVTAIKNYDYVYEIGYEFTKGSASENDFTATDRYFREISKGGKSVTAGDIFGLNYADAALAVWEITYDSNIEYEFKFYAKVGKLGSDGQTVVKQDPEQIVYGKTKNVVTYTEVKHYVRNINGSYTLKETETNVICMGTPTAKTYAGYNYGSNSVDGTVCNMYYELDGITFNVPNFTPTGFDGAGTYAAKGTVKDGENVYNNVYEGNVATGTAGAMLNIAYGNNVGKWLLIPVRHSYTYKAGALQFVKNGTEYINGDEADNYPTVFDKNGTVMSYDKNYTDWMIMSIYLDANEFSANGALQINLFLWRLGTVQIGEYTYLTEDQFNEFFGTTYSVVNHYVRMGDGSFALKDSETDVTCVGTPETKSYANRVYSSMAITDTVCDMFYEFDGITFNTPNFTTINFGSGTYTEIGTVENETSIRNNVYEGKMVDGTPSAFLSIAYGDNTGKWLLLPIKQNYGYVGDKLQFIDGKGNYYTDNNYPKWHDTNGAEITYDTAYTDWMIMAIYLDEAYYPANGALSANFFVWRLGTVQIGEYTFVTSEQIETLFAKTYSTVNHYARNIDGSFTLVETEKNVTCIGLPTAKNYSAHVYSTATVIDGVCDMFYEYEEITFYSTNTIYKWKGYVSSYQVIDGGAMAYDGKYRSTTKKIETISQSGEGAYFGIDGIGDKAGKYLVFAIKNAFTAIEPTVPQCNNAGNATISYFDANGDVTTYDKKTTEWYVAAIKITEALAANGNIGLDFFCWSTGAVTIGEYAFVTQEQLNLLGYYLGSETSDIQVNGWVAPESYSDDMLEKIAAAGLTSVSFAAAGTQYIAPADLSASKDIIKQYAKYGINVYTVGGIADFASIGDFANYGNVLGLMLDEPNKSQIDEIAAAVDTFNLANVGKKVLIVNLLPSYASAVTSDFSTYSAYFQYLYDNVLSKLKCELWISVDRYPIVRDAKGNPTLDSGWLGDVEAVATFAKANGLKKNFFIQTMPYGSGGFNDSHDRTPTKEDITLQYYVLLAYGYDSISLFCLGTPAPDGTTFLDGQNAMINRNNETTDIYTAVKEVNEELNKFDFILNRFSWDAAVLKTNSLLTSVHAKKIGLKDISSTKNALFSHLVDETRGREAYCVVNYNDTSLNYTNTITLTFSGETILTVIQNGGFRTVTSTSGEFTFTLGVGESIIVIK